MNKTVSVIICAMNVEKYICACLESVTKNDPFEILLVDGNSSDSTVSEAKKFNVKVLSDDGRGLSYARRIGVENARGDYILFIGPDNILEEGFINKFVTLLNEWRFDVGSVQTRVSNPINFWDKGLDTRWQFLMAKPGEINVAGTPSLYKAKCFENTNFSSDDFGPSDDTQLANDLKSRGFKIGLVPLNVYDQNGTSFISTWKRFKWYGSGDYFFYKKNHQKWSLSRKIFSLTHPLRQMLNYSVRCLFILKPQYIAWHFLFIFIARYYGWINTFYNFNFVKKEDT
jgi:glycosyltransferase involved in cell wall biosynthesis